MDFIGYFAGALTVAAYFPQALKTIRSRKTRDLSLLTFTVLTTSAVLRTIYGIGNDKPAIYATNGIVAILSSIIFAMKIIEG